MAGSKKEASAPAWPSSRRLLPALKSCMGQPKKVRYLTIALEMYDLPRAGSPTIAMTIRSSITVCGLMKYICVLER